jgi:hypothetical protein
MGLLTVRFEFQNSHGSELYEPVRICKWQRSKEYAIRDSKDRGRRADAESKGQERRERNGGRTQECPEPIPNVSHHWDVTRFDSRACSAGACFALGSLFARFTHLRTKLAGIR